MNQIKTTYCNLSQKEKSKKTFDVKREYNYILPSDKLFTSSSYLYEYLNNNYSYTRQDDYFLYSGNIIFNRDFYTQSNNKICPVEGKDYSIGFIDNNKIGFEIDNSSFKIECFNELHQMVKIVSDRFGNLYINTRPRELNGFLNNKLGIFILNGKYDSCSLSFKSNNKIIKYEYYCQVKANQFNFSQNPSCFNYINPITNQFIYIDTISNNLKHFTPYITTIGLYDDMGNLLAVAKLSKPIMKSKVLDLLIKVDLSYVV